MYHCHRATQFVHLLTGILFSSAQYVVLGQSNPHRHVVLVYIEEKYCNVYLVMLVLYLRSVADTDAETKWKVIVSCK